MTSLPSSVSESTEGLPSLAICNRHARARVYLQGAHVAAFRPVGDGEVLWTSVRSWFVAGKPIRGGVPLCFPWFGPHPQRPELPAHGFARLRPFTLQGARDLPDGRTQIELTLADDGETRAAWPHPFALTCAVTVGPALEMAVEVRNTGDRPFSYEMALHSYFDVADVRRAAVRGLEGARYLDKVDSGAEKRQPDAPITFAGETDRIYPGASGACVLEDPVQGRRIRIEKQDSRTTVVWNPWVAKAARMPDYGDDEWPGMVCVESANAGEDRVTLKPGETHLLSMTISVERPPG